jgi:hypothetical protein
MAKFEVATPDGRKFEIEAPDAQSASDTLDEYMATQGEAPPPGPEWRAPGAIVPIQFNTEGGARPAMPQLLTDAWNAFQAPGKALAGEYDQLEIDPQTGAVAPFDTRMMDDAANLASMISPTSPASRLSMPSVAAAGKLPTPEIDDLYSAKAAAYQTVDQLGAKYSAESVDNLYTDMIRRAENISPERHPLAYSTLVDLEKKGPQALSLTQLDQLRQVIRLDLVDSGSKAEAEFGRRFIQSIDDFIENASPTSISGVTGQTADYAIRTARKANTILRKSERLQDALEAARLRAAASGSGGNIDNAIRQELVRIVKDPRTFTAAEIAQMEAIIMGGGKLQDVLRKLGKLSPSGSGLMAALGIGGTMANPAAAVIPAVGLAAKAISDRTTQSGVQNLTNAVRSGAPPPLPRQPGALIPNANTTLIQQNFGPGMLPSIPAKIRLES